jgi:hypothetical protein
VNGDVWLIECVSDWYIVSVFKIELMSGLNEHDKEKIKRGPCPAWECELYVKEIRRCFIYSFIQFKLLLLLLIRNKLIKLKGKHNTVAIIYVDKTTAPLLYRLLQKLHPSSKDPTITYYSYCIDVPWLNTVFTVSSYFSSKPDLLLLLFNSTLLVPEFASPEPNHPKLLSLVFREKTPVCVNKMVGLSDIIKVQRKTRKMINEFWLKVDPNLFIDFCVFLSSFFYYLKLNTL